MTDRPAEGATQQLLNLLPAGTDQLPSWLPPVLTILVDGCGGGFDGGSDLGWLRRVGGRLQASGGAVPFAVVHDWQARTVLPMMLEAFDAAGSGSEAAEVVEPAEPAESVESAEPAEAADPVQAAAMLRRLHAGAAAGEPSDGPVWLAVLEPALHALYRLAYDYAGSYATAHASATAYATAHNFSPDGAVSFAESYAAHSADANRQSFAGSNAPATAAALAAAYAQAGSAAAEAAYAEAYPFALLRACAHAVAAAGVPAEQAGDPDRVRRCRQAAHLRLADGLADSLDRFG